MKFSKLFKLSSIIIINCLLFSPSFGQKLDWFIPPVLTEIDDVHIDYYTKNIIAVKKGSLWGAKSMTNELIVPLSYKSVQISHDSKVIATFDGQKMAYFDGEGYTTSKEIGEKANQETVKNREDKNRQNILDRGGLHRVYFNKVQNYIDKSLDTILRLTDTKDPTLYGDKYYVTVGISKDITLIYDKKGNLLKSFDFVLNNIIENKQGYYINSRRKNSKLFDKDFNLIEMPQCDGIRIHDSLNVIFIEHNGKYVIKDLKQNTLIQDSFPQWPFVVDNSDLVVIPHTDHVLVYSLSTKKVDKLLMTTSYPERNNPYCLVKENEKSGAYDFATQSFFLPAKFDFLSFTNNYYVGKYGDKKSKHYEIFNSEGQSIYNGHCNNRIFTKNGFIVLDTLKSYTWYDKTGKIIKKFEPGVGVEYNSTLNTIRLSSKSGEAQVYFAAEYLTQDKPRSFQAIGERLNNYEKDVIPLFMIKNKGKYGIIDINGNIVLEPTFTRVLGTKDDKWFVEYNGKLGLLNIPKIPV